MLRVDKIESIKAMHHGLVRVVHLVNHRPVCAPCARIAFEAGLTVLAGEYAEGLPIECESTFISGMFVPLDVCADLIHSTYGE